MENQFNSGLSAAIHLTMDSYHQGRALLEKSKTPDFTIKIANSLEEREAVFSLAYKIYLEKGYIKANSQEWLIQNYDSNSETIILIVQDTEKNIVGSATILFDGALKLPADLIYNKELAVLRQSDYRIAELSRLIINKENRNSKQILVLLFNYAAIFIRHVKKYNNLIVQVNPRHKNYYKSLLSFEEIGKEKPCPSVQNAPANLMSITSYQYQNELNRFSDFQLIKKSERSLFQYFLKTEQESLVAY